MTEIQRLAAAIAKISEKYLANVVAKGDKAGIAKWSLRLADYSTRLAVLVSPALTTKEAEEVEEIEVPEPLAIQAAAIKAQRAAHKALKDGAVPVPADTEGPLAAYTRAQTLDYLAQLTVCLRDGAFLPNASGPGLTILPGTERAPLDSATAEEHYPKMIAQLTGAGAYTAAEIAEAVERLEANLKAGVTLDPATAEGVA